MELEEAATHVRPTECQPHRMIGTISGQPFEAAIAVNLQHAIKVGQMFGGTRALAVLGVDVGCGRMGRTAPGPVIDRVAP